MGFGDFGSNGSVHWLVNYKETGNPDHADYDDTKRHPNDSSKPNLPVIGTRKQPKADHPGMFQVTMRYDDRAAATQALAGAQVLPSPGGGGAVVVVINVPVRPFSPVPGNPQDWEVRVDW